MQGLKEAIDRTGYYPEVVADGVMRAVAGEQVVAFFVHHEPTFDRDEVRRHLSVVVLTPTRLILAHTDEHEGDDLLPEPAGGGRDDDRLGRREPPGPRARGLQRPELRGRPRLHRRARLRRLLP